MDRRLRLLAITLVALAAVAGLVVFGLAPSGSSAGGRLAPALPRERLSGAPVTLQSLREGAGSRPTLVVFWASWCGPCEREAPALERFSRSAAGASRIVGVNWSDGLAGARAFIRRFGWTFPNVRDSEGTVGDAYRMPGLPTTFVIDGGGRIEAVLRGPQDEGSLTRALAAAERS